jgi:hypothetical protein
MSTLLPDIENTDVQTTLKGKASGELAHTITAYTQARQALLKPLGITEIRSKNWRTFFSVAHGRKVRRISARSYPGCQMWNHTSKSLPQGAGGQTPPALTSASRSPKPPNSLI